jgi:hypothetical protein
MGLSAEVVWFSTLQGLIGNPNLSIEDILAAAEKAASNFETRFGGKVPQ